MLHKITYCFAGVLLASNLAHVAIAQTATRDVAAAENSALSTQVIEAKPNDANITAIKALETPAPIEENKSENNHQQGLTLSPSVAPSPNNDVADIVIPPELPPPNLPADIPAYVPPQIINASQTDLWERIRKGFGIGNLNSPLTANHESWYAGKPEYFQRMTDRSARYLYYIVEEVEKRGMPTEIALLPMIESAYNPQAYSRSHASGIWQFVPATGKHYGLQQNWWYDGRRDVLAATRAALNYLGKLHNQFGSWDLALAAYNCGEGTVGRAIAANAAQGLPTDYKNLNLPDEARNYVPKLLGVKRLINNPERYGLSLLHVPNQPYFTTIEIGRHIDVKLAAEFANMSANDFAALNPAYNKPVISGHSPHIVLPVDRVETFVRQLSNYAQPLVSWQPYQAPHGQALNDIARRFNTSVDVLHANNTINQKRDKLHGAHTLIVPINHGIGRAAAGAAVATVQTAAFVPPAAVTHVALKQEIPVASIAAETVAPISSAQNYTVVQGDTLYGIGRRFGLRADDIKAANGLPSNALSLGQVLTLPQTTQTAVEQIAAATIAPTPDAPAAKAAKHTQYTVQYGDTVYGIARQFGVPMDDLLSWNNLGARHILQPGMTMKILAAN